MILVLLVVAVVAVLLVVVLCRRRHGSPIPKIIHQMACAPLADPESWPASWKKCQDTWKRLHPDFEYVLWTDDSLDRFMKREFPDFYPSWSAYDQNIKRIDTARYFILYRYGGIYADMDCECVQRFYEKLPSGKASIGESPWHQKFGERFQNSLMASPPEHPFWETVIAVVVERLPGCVDGGHVLQCTGPDVINEAAKRYVANGINALDRRKYAGNEKNESLASTRGMYVVHYGTEMWNEDIKSRASAE